MLRPPHRVLVVLEGESLFNDASALLIYRAAVGVTTTRTLVSAIPSLALAGVASVFAGILLARRSLRASPRIREVAPPALITFLSRFNVCTLSEQIHLLR